MNIVRKERRHYKRIFFSLKDGPVAVFNHPELHRKLIIATIMDLGLGGMGLSLRKDENLINVGDHLILTEIKGTTDLQAIVNIETRIKWLRNYEAFKHTLFGCEFVNISDDASEQIQEFIDSWINQI